MFIPDHIPIAIEKLVSHGRTDEWRKNDRGKWANALIYHAEL
jgi:hypothetical protein